MLRSNRFHEEQMITKPISHSSNFRSSSVFNVHGFFVGVGTTGQSFWDSFRNPTSPLDLKLFSNVSSSSVRSLNHPNNWDCSKVGLGLVNSFHDDDNACRMVFRRFENNNILFGSQMRNQNANLNGLENSPKDCAVASEILTSDSENSQLGSPPLGRGGMTCGEFSGSLPINLGSVSPPEFSGFLSASEIEMSEDYTCIVSHGPNPKTTHIFGDCILECHPIQSPSCRNKNEGVGCSSWMVKCSISSSKCSFSESLSYCFSCKKALKGKDSYISSGDKAACSCECREQEILIQEEREKPANDSSNSLDLCLFDEFFLGEIMTA